MIKVLKNNKMLFVGTIIIFIYILIAIFVSFLDIQSPVEMSTDILKTPTSEHILGTNDIGQDIFSRILYGARQSMIISMTVGVIASSIALIFGSLAALKGGVYDRITIRVAEVMLSLPNLVVCMLISAYVRPTVSMLVIILSLLEWAGPLKIIRAQVLVSKKHQSVMASKTFGASDMYIFVKHILPEIFPIVISTFIRCARIAVYMESGLAFLGLSDPLTISWGKIISDAMAYTYLPVWKNWLLPTGIVLSILLFSLSYIGNYFENSNFMDKRGKND